MFQKKNFKYYVMFSASNDNGQTFGSTVVSGSEPLNTEKGLYELIEDLKRGAESISGSKKKVSVSIINVIELES
jgi:hypothetical protein